jgi:acyl-CoA hydrolase
MSLLQPKTAKESLTILTDLVLPGETNPLNSLFGGELLARMDRACSIAARRHSRSIVVTVSVNHVTFEKAVPVGSVITLEAKVSRAFSTSMEIIVDVWMEERLTGNKMKVSEGIYTFVAVNNEGLPMAIPAIIPESELEKERYHSALRRKQLSLVLSHKMEAKDATELKKLFE